MKLTLAILWSMILIIGAANASDTITYHRDSRILTLTWTSSINTIAYEVWQDNGDTEILVGETIYNLFTIGLKFGEMTRVRVVPIDYTGKPQPERTSVYSNWYIYGLKIEKVGETIVLTWGDDLGTVSLYRSEDMINWNLVTTTNNNIHIEYQAISYDKMFYKIEVK